LSDQRLEQYAKDHNLDVAKLRSFFEKATQADIDARFTTAQEYLEAGLDAFTN